MDSMGSARALLIIQELLGGARSEEHLMTALGNLAAGERSDVLGPLLRAGIIQRSAAGPDHVDIYHLTDLGRAAQPVVEALEAWGRGLP